MSIPDFLRIPADVRKAAWDAQPPRPMPVFANVTSRAVDQSVEDFKRQAEEERRIASLNRIAKMKAKQATGKVDPKTHRWDSRRAKFVLLEPWAMKKSAPVYHVAKNGLLQSQSAGLMTETMLKAKLAPLDGLEYVTKDNAERIAKLNGVWKDSYGSLQAGLMTMSVKNRLKRLVKDGRAIIFE